MNTPSHEGAQPTSPIDLTMMYAVHDAFRRDLALLSSAASTDIAAFTTCWQTFKNYLTIHHTAEDTSLWPVMEPKLTGQESELTLLEDMEAEHARLDPMMEQIDTLLASRQHEPLRGAVEDLSALLIAHLQHEEAKALPLIQNVLTPREWDGFSQEQRKSVGLKGAGDFFPWLLDGAPEPTQRKILAMVPPPVRLVYRLVWRPRYERRSPWRQHVSS